MTNRVHRPVKMMQTAARQSTVDGARPDALRHELPARDDPVLAPCKRSDPRVGVTWMRFSSHIVVKCNRVRHRAMVARKV
jgi:hypothetical protein